MGKGYNHHEIFNVHYYSGRLRYSNRAVIIVMLKVSFTRKIVSIVPSHRAHIACYGPLYIVIIGSTHIWTVIWLFKPLGSAVKYLDNYTNSSWYIVYRTQYIGIWQSIKLYFIQHLGVQSPDSCILDLLPSRNPIWKILGMPIIYDIGARSLQRSTSCFIIISIIIASQQKSVTLNSRMNSVRNKDWQRA